MALRLQERGGSFGDGEAPGAEDEEARFFFRMKENLLVLDLALFLRWRSLCDEKVTVKIVKGC